MRQIIYNTLVGLLPYKEKTSKYNSLINGKRAALLNNQIVSILKKHKAYGASFALFANSKIIHHTAYGNANDREKIDFNTFYRIASVSKMLLAACILKLSEKKLIDLDMDVSKLLNIRINKGFKLNFRALLSHTAGIHDSELYNNTIGTGVSLANMLVEENFRNKPVDNVWEYSNLGYGIIASALEMLLNTSVENIVQEHLFKPLSIKASYYPQTIDEIVANSYTVFPKTKLALNMDERKSRDYADAYIVSPETHYVLSPGNMYIDIDGALKIADILINDGYLSKESLANMRTSYAGFGIRDKYLCQGLGLFILNYPYNSPVFYGHQGFAYSAMHGIFFDAERKDGFILFTAGCSEKRTGVLSDINKDFIKLWQEKDIWVP